MPIYEYVCTACGKEEELLQRVGDPPPPCTHETCSRQGQTMEKRVSRSSFELKGGGWAKDGYG